MLSAAGAFVVLVDAAAFFLCLWVFDLWVLCVFGGAEAAASCAITKPEVAAKKATAKANTIDFFIEILLKVVQQATHPTQIRRKPNFKCFTLLSGISRSFVVRFPLVKNHFLDLIVYRPVSRLLTMVKILNEQKHADQKKRFVAQARKLFASHGVMETSMSQIARACKVTKAGLYHYFKSKDQILKEIFLSHVEEKDAVVDLLKQAKSLEECFYLLGKHHLLEMNRPEHVELMKIMLSETMKNPEMRKFYVHFITEQLGFIVQEILIPKLRSQKPEKEINLLFFQFFASLMHYSWHQMMVGDITPLIGDGETFVRTLAKTYAGRFQQA